MKTIEVTETEYDYLQKIRVVLAKDQRVELVPNIGKGTVKVLSVKREEVRRNRGFEAHRKSGGDEGA